VVPLSFIQAYFSACRATGRLSEAIVTGVVTGAAGISATAAAGTARGLTGMAVCWVFALAAAGIWSIWRLRRLLRQTSQDMASGRRVAPPVTHGTDTGSWDMGAAG
jgi:hypothetical protein